MCDPLVNRNCIQVNSEFVNSSSIIIFFWFLGSVFTFSVAIVKLIKKKDVHYIESYEMPQRPENYQSHHHQRDQMRSLPNEQNNENFASGEIQSNSSVGSNDADAQRQNQFNPAQFAEQERKASQPSGWRGRLSLAVDLFVTKHLVIMIVFIFLVNNFASYTYAAVCMLLILIHLITFNYIRLFDLLKLPKIQPFSELTYHFWILTLFFNYLVFDQSLTNLP